MFGLISRIMPTWPAEWGTSPIGWILPRPIPWGLLQKDTPWTLEEQQQAFEFIDNSNELLESLLNIQTYDDFKTFVESYKKRVELSGGAK